MEITAKLIEMKISQPIDNNFIEAELSKMGINPLRWAIVKCGSRCEPILSCEEQDKQGKHNDGKVRVLEQSSKNSTGAIENKIILTISLACENL